MNDLVEGCRVAKARDRFWTVPTPTARSILTDLRRRVGMVFQQPNPFPMSVYDNVAFGPRTHGVRAKRRSGRHRGAESLRDGRHLGRAEGPPEEERARPVRRPAAAPVHRSRPGRAAPRCCCWTSPRARSTPSPRRRSRTSSASSRSKLHGDHGDPQHAAGPARLRQDGVLPAGRGGGGRRHRRLSSPPPPTPAPPITSLVVLGSGISVSVGADLGQPSRVGCVRMTKEGRPRSSPTEGWA